MGTIVISLLLASGLWFGQHKTFHYQDQQPPPCNGSGCGFGGGGGGAF